MRNLLLAIGLTLFGLFTPSSPLLAIDGQWRTLGPDGARVTDLVFQPGNPHVMYASVPGGVFKSVDGGATWVWSGVGINARNNGGKLAIDPVQPSTIYVSQSALYRSRNGGQTWRFAGRGAEYGVAVHPRVSGTVFAASEQGLFRSLNGGHPWTRLTRGLPESYRATLITFDPTSERRLYASIQDPDTEKGGLYRSLDGGVTWQPIHSGLLRNRRVYSLAVDPRSPQTLYASTSTRVFKSTNGGFTWRRTALTGFMAALKVHPSQSNVVYAGGDGGVFRSQDGGATWARLSQGLPNLSVLATTVTSLVLHPSSPQTVYVGVEGLFEQAGVFKSTDGGSSWALSSRGLSGLAVNSIAVRQGDPATLWVIANTVLFKSTDRGLSWARVRPGPGIGDVRATQVAVDPVNPATVYVMLPNGDLRRTHNGGQIWEAAANPGVTPFGNTKIVLDPLVPSTIYAAGLGIAKSTDGGTTWTHLTGDPADMVVHDLVISSSTLYATGGGGTGGQRVLKSIDGGATWARIHQGLPINTNNTTNIFDLEVDPLDPATAYAPVAYGVIYKTSDGGTTWTLLSDTFRDKSMALHVTPSGLLYAGVAFDNTYELQEGAGTWEPLGQDSFGLFHSTLVVVPGDPCRIYVGSSNRGLLAFTKAGC